MGRAHLLKFESDSKKQIKRPEKKMVLPAYVRVREIADLRAAKKLKKGIVKNSKLTGTHYSGCSMIIIKNNENRQAR
jgi:hypothetical protein